MEVAQPSNSCYFITKGKKQTKRKPYITKSTLQMLFHVTPEKMKWNACTEAHNLIIYT